MVRWKNKWKERNCVYTRTYIIHSLYPNDFCMKYYSLLPFSFFFKTKPYHHHRHTQPPTLALLCSILLLISKSAVSCLKRFVLRHENVYILVAVLFTRPIYIAHRKKRVAYWCCFCCTYNVTTLVAMMYETLSILLVDANYGWL